MEYFMIRAIHFALHFAMVFLGVIIAIHFDMTLGLVLAGTFAVKFLLMAPSTDENERLRRYD